MKLRYVCIGAGVALWAWLSRRVIGWLYTRTGVSLGVR